MDYRGYNYYSICFHNYIDKNFPSENYQIHCLSNLSQFFFPENAQSTVIGVEGTDTTTVIQTNTDGSVVAIRKLKS